ADAVAVLHGSRRLGTYPIFTYGHGRPRRLPAHGDGGPRPVGVGGGHRAAAGPNCSMWSVAWMRELTLFDPRPANSGGRVVGVLSGPVVRTPCVVSTVVDVGRVTVIATVSA